MSGKYVPRNLGLLTDCYGDGVSNDGGIGAVDSGDGVEVLEIASGSGDTLVGDWLWRGVAGDGCVDVEN